MAYFQNAVCPVCEKPLNAQDDIVVCPECGAPYHRACYKKVGRCLYEDKHSTGFSYLPEPSADKNKASEEEGGFVICPHCHKGNPLGSIACENCGTLLPPTSAPAAHEQPGETSGVPAYRRSRSEATPDTGKFRPLGDGGIHFDEASDPMEELKAQLDQNEKLDGFTLREWLSYIGPSGPLYLFQFKRMDEMEHGRPFSLSAALFAPVYFLYRKMWGWGILSLIGKLLCGAPAILSMLYSQHIVSSLPFSASVLNRFSLYGVYLDVALSLFWALSAYTFYRSSCLKNMMRVKRDFEQTPSAGADALYVRLAHKGGVSTVAITVLAILALALYLPVLFRLGL